MNSPYMGKFRVSQCYKGAAHDGLDLVGIDSKEIHSTVHGTVLYAGWENNANHAQGFGKYVKIRKTGSDEVYYFGHLSELHVRTGDEVRITDVIGIEGSTGRSTGSHCHYCVRRGGVKGQHADICAISKIPNIKGTYTDGYLEKLLDSQKKAQALGLNVGDKVYVKSGARDYDGRKLASFVYQTEYTVLEIRDSRVVIGLGTAVTAAVHIDNLLSD